MESILTFQGFPHAMYLGSCEGFITMCCQHLGETERVEGSLTPDMYTAISIKCMECPANI